MRYKIETNWANPPPPPRASGQTGGHFANDILICIEKFCILIRISLQFGQKDPIHNQPVLVPVIPVITLRRIGETPVHEAMLTQFTD